MLEMMMGGKTENSVYLDISFEDAVVGSTDLYDKISKTNLQTKRSTYSGSTESTVINDATYGKVLSLGSGRFWWLDNLAPNTNNLVTELQIVVTSLSSQEYYFLSTGGSIGGSYKTGYGLKLASGVYGAGLGLYPENSGAPLRATVPYNQLITVFIEHDKTGTRTTFGMREVLPIGGPYDGRIGTGFYFGGPPDISTIASASFSNTTKGFVKSIKMYKK